MEDTLKTNIFNKVDKGNHLSFKINLEMQGGPLVQIFLNDRGIGQIYTYDSIEKSYKHIPKGTSSELKLADSLEEWVHNDFFQFITNDDQNLTFGDPIEGLFFLIEKEIFLTITMHGIDDFGEEIENDEEESYESYEYSLGVIEDYINNN